jgi:UDP-3-O-[3-hydroxymyristoyl] glucosamine N-acyltransferase
MDNKVKEFYSKDLCRSYGLKHFGKDILLKKPCSLESVKKNSFFYVTRYSVKLFDKISKVENLFIIFSDSINLDLIPKNISYTVFSNPRQLFFEITDKNFVKEGKVNKTYIDPSANILGNVKIGKKVYIGRDVIINGPCKIDDGVHISENSFIDSNTTIGKNTFICSQVLIGKESLSLRNDGSLNKQNSHIGGTKIGRNCRIGLNSFVSKGTIDDTVLSDNVMIGEYVSIAHNVQIGKNSVLTVGSRVCGSVKIKNSCWLGPNAIIMSQVNLTNNVKLAAGAVLHTDASKSGTYLGNPAKLLKIKKS